MLTVRKSMGLMVLLVVLGVSGTAEAKRKTTHKYTSTLQSQRRWRPITAIRRRGAPR